MGRTMQLLCSLALGLVNASGLVEAGQNRVFRQPESQSRDQPIPPDADTVANPAQLAATLVNLTQDWITGKLSTPGITADVREFSRTREQGRLRVKYHVFVSGAPKDQTYISLQWPINAAKPSELLRGLTFSEDGLVICAGRTPEQCRSGERKDDPVDFTFYSSKGEIFRMALVSEDGAAKVFFAIVPDPITKRDKSCSVEALQLLPSFALAMILAKGYQANESLLFVSKSDGETQEKQVKADVDGNYTSALLPFVKNKQNGRTELKLSGASCSPALSFDWGK